MNPAPPQPTEGWYPDPYHRYEYRWFNGSAWTGDVSNDGERLIDPYGADPAIPAVTYGTVGLPGYGTGAQGAATAPPRQASATASIVLGVLAILTTWIPFIFVIGVILAIIGIMLGFSGRRASLSAGQQPGASTAGIVLGFIALGLTVIGILLSVMFFNAANAFTYPGPLDVSVDSCRTSGGAATVSGSVTNRSTTTRSYSVYVHVDGATNTVIPETIDDVQPGDSAEFSVIVLAPSDASTCEAAVEVFGPLPFGIEMNPPN